MLRNVFVFLIIIVGAYFAFHGPFYALLFYLWNAYFRPESWVWDPLIGQLNLSLTIGVYLILVSFNAIQNFRWSRQVVFVALFFLQSLVSLIFSEAPAWSQLWWIEFAKVQVVTLLITLLVNDRKKYRLTLVVIAYSLGLETAKQGWAQLLLNPGATNNNTSPLLGDNNGVAVGMMMLIPVFVALNQTARHRWERYLHNFFIVGVLYRGISTYSRGGFLAAGAMGLVLLWYSPKKIRMILSTVILAYTISLAMPQSFWDRMETITASDDARDSSSAGRLHFWTVAVRMANAKPFTGVGFNAFRRAFGRYDPQGEWGDDRAVHSAWFGVLAEMGYPGLILMVTIIVGGLGSAWRIGRKARGDPALLDFRSYARAMQATLVAYVVGMTFLHGQYSEMFWHFVGLGVALERSFQLALQEQTEKAVVATPAAPPIGLRSRFHPANQPAKRISSGAR
ncbi:MAG: putative O-glycosylation ligase, exosortase A system-associated [Vicinamibacterales bacterium]